MQRETDRPPQLYSGSSYPYIVCRNPLSVVSCPTILHVFHMGYELINYFRLQDHIYLIDGMRIHRLPDPIQEKEAGLRRV